MKDAYTTLHHDGESEYTEKRSRFLGHARPCKSESEAIAFIEEMRKRYSDARHNVYAYLLTEGNLMRYSDDSEPQGKAGLPVLDILRKGGITDAAIVVTRYFGGILLGTGGLVRAYSTAAADAVENAGIVTYRSVVDLAICCDYSEYGKISAMLPSFTCVLEDTQFTDSVKLRVTILQEEKDAFAEKLREMTAGKVAPTVLGKRFALL